MHLNLISLHKELLSTYVYFHIRLTREFIIYTQINFEYISNWI